MTGPFSVISLRELSDLKELTCYLPHLYLGAIASIACIHNNYIKTFGPSLYGTSDLA